ncbi:PREDICTED: rho GTPase-activating protein 25 [Nanorana parkeri]|uniref:rho GTPase-activating protein 25 n=1 Tax=Nanorana parkeri TaxID=125878 RepID=UPI000854FEBC|nr:PREDICTED: rho GTPase-activating protein 25 [Nanorana parkeri]
MSLKLPGKWDFSLKSDFARKAVRTVSMMTSDQSLSARHLHNSLEKPVKSGWLKKQQKSIVKNWHNRYFVLKGQHLWYYKDEDDQKPQGFLFLPRSSVSEVSCNPDDVGKYIFDIIPGLSLDPNKPVPDGYTLMAGSSTEMEEWVKAIKKAAGFPSGAVFGQRLADTIVYERKYGRHLVPLLMEKCADFILENGLNEEGIFRLPGQDNLVKQLKEAFDAGERPSFTSDTDVHTVASLFKLYLRELPEPVFPWSQYEDCLACENTMNIDEEKGHEELRKQIMLLPKENYNLLCFICRFLYKVQNNSSVNKMSVENLAMVIGVNLLKPKTEDPVALMRGAPQIQKLMTVMISLHEKFFPKTNDQPPEPASQKNDFKMGQVPRSSVGWDAAEESFSPSGDPPIVHGKNTSDSRGSSTSEDSTSLNEDHYSLLTDNSESWSTATRKRTQTLPITNFNMPRKQDDSSTSTFNKADFFASDFWGSPNGKSNLLSSPGHKRTLSEEFSQQRISTYDNVPIPQSGSDSSKLYSSGAESPVTKESKEPNKLSSGVLRNGVDCLVPENSEGNSCGLLVNALEEMKVHKKQLQERVKSLEKENFEVWKKVVKLNEDMEKEQNQRKALEITLQNMERSRNDAEKRNKLLEQEIQGFVRAMSQAGNKP